MGVGFTSFGFDCLKGFGAGSNPARGSNDDGPPSMPGAAVKEVDLA